MRGQYGTFPPPAPEEMARTTSISVEVYRTESLYVSRASSSKIPLPAIDPLPLGVEAPLTLPLAPLPDAICQAGIPFPLGSKSLLAASCVELILADPVGGPEVVVDCRDWRRVLSDLSSD